MTAVRWTLVVGLALLLTLPLAAADPKPVRHRILLAEYGKGPNRLIEVSADGKLVWEHKPPSISVIFQVLPGGHVGCLPKASACRDPPPIQAGTAASVSSFRMQAQYS